MALPRVVKIAVFPVAGLQRRLGHDVELFREIQLSGAAESA